MIKIYGSLLCKDCVECKAELDAAGVPYTFLDFSENLTNLKEFLAIRDTHVLFAEVRKEGKIGIPCIVGEDGNIMLEWESLCNRG